MAGIDRLRSGSQFERTLRKQFKEAFGEIQKKDKELRGRAASYLKDKIAAKINSVRHSLPGEPPGKMSGNLLKGLAVKNGAFSSIVGFKKPGFHALILEFGTKMRMVKKHAKSGQPESSGQMAPRPVLFPTFAEEAGAVKMILSEKRN